MKINNPGFSRRQHIRTILAIVFCYNRWIKLNRFSLQRATNGISQCTPSDILKLNCLRLHSRLRFNITSMVSWCWLFFPCTLWQGSSVEVYLNDDLLWCMLIRVGMIHVFSNESSDVLGLVSMSSWGGGVE